MMPALLVPLISLFLAPLELRLLLRRNDFLESRQLFAISWSPDRNITVVADRNAILLDRMRELKQHSSSITQLVFSCLNDSRLAVRVDGKDRSPDEDNGCSQLALDYDLIIGDQFIGCIVEIAQKGRTLLRNFCRERPQSHPPAVDELAGVEQQLASDWPVLDSSEVFAAADEGGDDPPRPTGIEPLYLAEPLLLDEGATLPIQWNNLYVFPYHSRYNISNKEIVFRLVDGPQHGSVHRYDRPVANFTYQQVLAKEIIYIHDGSETLEDAIDLQVDMKSPMIKFPSLEHQIYSLPIRIRPINDAPELRLGPQGHQLKMAKKSRYDRDWDGPSLLLRIPLSEQLIHLSDVDDEPHKVIVRVTGASGVHLELRNGRPVNEFTQRELLNDQVRLIHDGTDDKCELRLVAEDSDSQSRPITLTIATVSAEVHLERNTGISVLQQSSAPITATNLSFTSNVPDSMIEYKIVDLPEFGVVECEDAAGQYRICSDFDQSNLIAGQIRYRHSSNAHPNSDSFSFQVRSSNATSSIHRFKISFIPVHVKVFNRQAFLLNASDSMFITREHLFAWTFPRTTVAQKLIYHIVEPPKFGILQRRIEANRNRRIGVSSNFTQQHIDQQLIFYKLHFIQYSVINDFFTFRVIAPSVTSELVTFDITYVPGVGAIQLINRTIIVEEGSTQQITNYTLSLETPDDNNFAFTIGVAPTAGNILLITASGAKFTLTLGQNFTTSDIKAGRVYFEHDGSETSEDRMYLVAESVYRRTSRVPFWLGVRAILVNDNPPTLAAASGSGEARIDVVERSQRQLDRSLLPWKDADIDSQPLQYHFRDAFRNAAILTVRAPHIPVRNFTDREIASGQLMLRHLGYQSDFLMPYTVSDGVHHVDAQLRVTAEQPFLRLTANTGIQYPESGTEQLVAITAANLTARTNLDVNNSHVIFRVLNGTGFVYSNGSTQNRVETVTQEDIDRGRLFFRGDAAVAGSTIAFSVSVQHLSLVDVFRVRRRVDRLTLEMRQLSTITIPISSLALISAKHLQAVDSNFSPSKILYRVTKQPSSGTLILESSAVKENGLAIAPSNFFVSEFTQENVDLGHLQYLHGGSLPSRDLFTFNVTTDQHTIGPFTMFINVVDDQLELFVSNATVTAGGNVVLGDSLIHALSHQDDQLEYRIVSSPTAGWVVLDSWNLENITSIETFTNDQIKDRRLFYVNDGASSSQSDRFSIVVCLNEHKCTESKQIRITVHQRNLRGPQLIRNEVLRMWNAASAPITSQLLSTQDDDTSAEFLHYIVSRPSNGFLARQSRIDVPIFNFSQAEIDNAGVVFVKAPNSTMSGGFSFLVSDGLHQIGPDWFTVESTTSSLNVALEANGRLVTAPGPAAIIGMDLLRANIPHVTPEQILFRIIKAPKLGSLLVGGLPSREFSQAAINRRAVAYRTRKETITGWAKKDWFHFIVVSNGTADPMNEEHRFRILVTYAALPPDRIPLYVSTTPIVVGAGGSTALNGSHIDVSRLVALIGEPILVEVARLPRFGRLQWTAPLTVHNTTSIINSRMLYSSSELLQSGTSLIYHHDGASSNGDEMLLHLYPASEGEKRGTIRLRIHIRVETTERLDPTLRIESMPNAVDLVSGSKFAFSANNFLAVSDHVKPASIIYEVTQTGRRVGVFVDDLERWQFTQADINKGRVTLSQRDSKNEGWNQSVDVVGIRVGHHTRALLVHVQPVALLLINHTTIAYPQGKTYIVLNRDSSRAALMEVLQLNGIFPCLQTPDFSSHLGAYSNGDSRKIIYTITTKPENGTFYWVAGEKEATSFSQTDIDEGKVLYAQLNMNSYQDAFEFSLGNENKDSVQSRSNITVIAAVKPQRLIAEAAQFVPITIAHLNASSLQGSSPRFLVVRGPNYGRIVVINSKTANESMASYFTLTDVLNGQVFYISQPIELLGDHHEDRVEFELRADGVQPARATLRISIRRPPVGTAQPATRPPPVPGTTPWLPNVTQLSDNLPIAILAAIVATTIAIVYCRRRKITTKRKRKELEEKARKQREHEEAERRILPDEQPDLLDTTVYATVAKHKPRGEMLRPQMKTFDATSTAKRAPKLSAAASVLSGSRASASAGTFPGVADLPPSSGTFSGTLPPVLEAASERPRSGSTGQKSRSTTSGSAVSSIIHRPPPPSAAPQGSSLPSGRSPVGKLKGNQYWV